MQTVGFNSYDSPHHVNDERAHQDHQRGHLYEMIEQAFPAEKYAGAITQYDPGPWAEELDEERALFDTLKDKTWLDTSPAFLSAYPDAYLLLTRHAYTAFIAAWLRHSLERMQGENQVRELLIYTCSPPGHCWKILSPLNREQRATISALMSEFANRERNGFIKEKAIKALARMDELIAAGKDVPWTG